MSMFNITYYRNDKLIHKESVFMLTLNAAKISATRQSSQKKVYIRISNIMDKPLSERINGKWKNIDYTKTT